jgi:hypothetical protein
MINTRARKLYQWSQKIAIYDFYLHTKGSSGNNSRKVTIEILWGIIKISSEKYKSLFSVWIYLQYVCYVVKHNKN